MATIFPNPAMQDLKITFHESTLVFPAQQTEKKVLFLSSMDQLPNYKIPTAFFFASNPDYTPETVAKKLKSAVEKVLVPYDFMAGRLRLNNEDRLEIDCNAAGAGFVVAASEFTLAEIGDLVCPNLGFRQLAVQKLDNLGLDDDDQPLFILQVTSFKCGGFAIGMSVNHILLDGSSAKTLNENLASQAFDDKPLAVVPCFDRRLLPVRSPPQVVFPHPEFSKPAAAPNSGPPVFNCEVDQELEHRVFKLTPTDINLLKETAKSPDQPNPRISSFSAVAALIWRCKALSFSGDEQSKDRVSVLLKVVDLRTRLTDPPMPAEYCGNALWMARSAAECGDLENWAFSKIVEIVAEAPGKITDDYARSALDWLEVNKGTIPCGEYMVNSWLRLGFEKVAYPWGTPVHSGPVVFHRKKICWIFPTADCVNAMVSLPAAEIKRFESLFQTFFKDNSSINGVH